MTYNETSRDWDICRAVDLYRAHRNKGDDRTLADFLSDVGLVIAASPPEQPAAAPVTPTNLRQALIDEAKPLRYGEPVWPNNDEVNDLDKGDDA